LSCLVLPCLALSCLVLSCLVLSCPVVSCRVVLFRFVSCLVLSCLAMAQRIIVGVDDMVLLTDLSNKGVVSNLKKRCKICLMSMIRTETHFLFINPNPNPNLLSPDLTCPNLNLDLKPNPDSNLNPYERHASDGIYTFIGHVLVVHLDPDLKLDPNPKHKLNPNPKPNILP
jgi:hypothetical protein